MEAEEEEAAQAAVVARSHRSQVLQRRGQLLGLRDTAVEDSREEGRAVREGVRGVLFVCFVGKGKGG